MRRRFPGKGGKRRSASLMTAFKYGRGRTVAIVIELGLANVLRISAVSLWSL